MALALGLSALGRHLGLSPLPPGVIHHFAPLAGVVGRWLGESVRRGLWVLLVLVSPLWAGIAFGAASPFPIIDEHLELPSASLPAFALVAALLLTVLGHGVLAAIGVAGGTGRLPRDAVSRWIARATAIIKSGRGAKSARLECGAARPHSA